MRDIFKVALALIALLLVVTLTTHAETKTIINGEYIIAEIHTQDDAIDIDEAPPINRISEDLDEQDANGHHLEYLGEFNITHYCSCRKCNGKNAGLDGFGKPLEWGCIAVDPKVIPMHTKVVIDGYDMVFEARDTGSGITGRDIDIFVPVSHSEALKMGQNVGKKVWLYHE